MDNHDQILTRRIREVARAALPIGRSITKAEGFPLGSQVIRMRFELADGSVHTCVVKRAGRREVAWYRLGLDRAATGAPSLLGSAGSWLFLEALPESFPAMTDGAEVERVYRHLAGIHRRFAGELRRRTDLWSSGDPWEVPLGEIRRILTGAGLNPASAAAAAHRLTEGPVTLLHGDYHRWNLLVQNQSVRVVDWETAGTGHPVWDLALVEPEGPGWDGAPAGAAALAALRAYHAHGPLCGLGWAEFCRLQAEARLFALARRVALHLRRGAAARDPAAAEVILAHARRDQERVRHLAGLLHRQ